jgi:hypothetical protein
MFAQGLQSYTQLMPLTLLLLLLLLLLLVVVLLLILPAARKDQQLCGCEDSRAGRTDHCSPWQQQQQQQQQQQCATAGHQADGAAG